MGAEAADGALRTGRAAVWLETPAAQYGLFTGQRGQGGGTEEGLLPGRGLSVWAPAPSPEACVCVAPGHSATTELAWGVCGDLSSYP